jgi:hypothetical protein
MMAAFYKPTSLRRNSAQRLASAESPAQSEARRPAQSEARRPAQSPQVAFVAVLQHAHKVLRPIAMRIESARNSAARLFAASVVPAAMACVLAGVTAGGCAGTPAAREASANSLEGTLSANEQRCWDGASQSRIVVCRAEARMRNARRDGKLALFECYDDKVQQMHMQQRLGGRTGLPISASTAGVGESSADLRARADQRIGELWMQLGECGIDASSPAASVLASSNP